MDRELNRDEFERFRALIYRLAGIHYPLEKLELLTNRVRKRLRATAIASYEAYLDHLQHAPDGPELQAFLDCVTTNETYFFRCQRHWEWFRQRAAAHRADGARACQRLRLWSAAASTGAEAFTALIVLHQVLGDGFAGTPVEVLGTDLSKRVLDEAARGVFRPYALAQTPADVLARYFERTGTGDYLFDRALARNARFRRHNLMAALPPSEGTFDVVFLRNVMIYFDSPSRERVLQHVFAAVRPGGHLVVGESESLLNVAHGFRYVQPSIFCRPDPVAAARARR